MHRCLQLAALGAGYVAPNPMVGAVLVHQNRIIGEGYHKQFGAAHAEVNCLQNVADNDRELIADSTLYVSLEPCAHYGKTPPCADLIISHNIKTVVVGCRDPFEKVDGKGIEKLQNAGITVIVGVLEADCVQLNKRFFCFHQEKRPYIILKWAESVNHCIAGEHKEQVSISGPITNRLVHRWRTEEAAIAVGTATALLDNPALTARLWPGHQPLRVVLDKQLVVPEGHQLFSEAAPTLVFNQLKSGKAGDINYIKLNNQENLVTQLLQNLYALQVQSVLIEGGTKFIQSFIQAKAWDEARVITNTEMVIAAGYAAPVLDSGRIFQSEQLGTDLIQYFNPA